MHANYTDLDSVHVLSKIRLQENGESLRLVRPGGTRACWTFALLPARSLTALLIMAYVLAVDVRLRKEVCRNNIRLNLILQTNI